MRAQVVGAGSWGTALALVLARNGWDVVISGRASDSLEQIATRRENLRYLPGFVLPKSVTACEIGAEEGEFDLQVHALPSSAVLSVLDELKPGRRIVLASKGLIPTGDGILCDAVAEVWPDAAISVISGPNLAVELAKGIPTAAVVASKDDEVAERVRDAFMCRTYRVYVSNDVRGVELAGALKNVLAIGAGVSDGLGFGDNTKAAVLARGLNEMARLGHVLGASLATFMGVAGVGDLMATANSTLSRNYRVGFGLGQGRSLTEILEEIGQVAEGVPTADQAVRLARKYEVPMPIFQVLHGIIIGDYDPRDAVQALMERTPKREGFDWL
ncbi:MAG: NAD(P)-dependent glycerol-3-phosphate dehydrogenase [Fimbriimonadaceae bacterium]|nr:NAD(P)-dependent glycerol-3-phosphate dehydrogenase [Fimbriimonadaceae bacterium]